ncbi:MAG: prolyl-tRNA synthetase associated domain-containing protein [Proteobacteria bacterium]|nr:prolyl-tRNA synthetase associated domain-containing protein [Pseudomonadota bacterium]
MPKETPAQETPSQETGAQETGARLPTRPEDLLARLDELGIAARTFTHPPVHTVAEAKARRGEIEGAHIKNLFLRNKKGAMWLITCLEDREIDLKALGRALDAGRFSFGSAARLMTYLGVEPGAVTPFGVINDTEGKVRMVLDKALLDRGPINAHPLVNDMTVAVSPEGLLRFLEAAGHPPRILDFEALSDPG